MRPLLLAFCFALTILSALFMNPRLHYFTSIKSLFFPSMSAMAGKVMHAVCYEAYGGGSAGLKHVEVPVPTPQKNEVLLKLEAASINPIDWKIQTGMLQSFLPLKFPFVPVTDVAGEVAEIGSGVKKFKAGDKIVAKLDISTGGGFAEYAVAQESLTVKRTPEVSAAEGAGLPTAGIASLQALTKSAGLRLDSTGKEANVLVTAASGGVGHYAVQLAKHGNIHVTATCGARNIQLVKGLGADEVLDYKTTEGSSLKSPSGRKYDVVIHCTTGIPWSIFEPNLNEYGKVVDITPSPSSSLTIEYKEFKKMTSSKKELVPFGVAPNSDDLELLVRLVKEGKLKTVVDSRYPLSRAEDAWAKSIEGHATGKIIVEP